MAKQNTPKKSGGAAKPAAKSKPRQKAAASRTAKKKPAAGSATKPGRRAVSRKVYAVTGCSGYIGRKLTAKLLARDDVARVVGIDVVGSHKHHPKFVFHKLDMRDPGLVKVLADEGVNGILHLAFVVDPFYDESEMHDVNVRGSRNVLAAAAALGVRHLVFVSSTTAYGAHPDNPVPLKEADPTRGNPEFQYARDKAEVDEITRRFARENPDIRVNIVRPCIILGPNVANYIAAQFLIFPLMPKVNGQNLPFQFVHEDDVVEILVRTVDKPVSGIFNAVGTGYMHTEELARLMRKPAVFIPEVVLRLVLTLLWKSRLTSQGVPPGIIEFYCHPWVADGSKTGRELGFIPKHSSEEAFRALYEHRKQVVANLRTKFRARGRR